MVIDSHNSGLEVMSRTMPRKTAIRMPSETFKNGSCNLLRNSELIAWSSAQVRRIARMRLPVMAPSGTIRRRAPTVTLGHANPKADIRMAK